jgi:hypothetical protein
MDGPSHLPITLFFAPDGSVRRHDVPQSPNNELVAVPASVSFD